MGKKPIVVEYLIIVKQKGSFCESDKAFLQFLAVDSSLSIHDEDKKIEMTLKDNVKFTADYEVKSDLIPSKEQRYFKFKLSSEESKLKEFNDLTNILEEIISKLDSEVRINILWNDIARHYAIEGYSLINEVENLLRRLIANFMLINVGYEWHKYYIPISVEERDSSLKGSYSDYLHQTYFSDLKTILFEGQRNFNLRGIGDIQRLVEKYISDKKKDIPISELKGVIATSLWEKYFAKDAKYKKEDIENDLEQLNRLRNEIAHNRHINRATLGKIQALSKKIIKALNLEIEKLPEKALTEEEQKFQVEINKEEMGFSESNIDEKQWFSSITKILLEWYGKTIDYDIEVLNFPSGVDFGVDFILEVKDPIYKHIGVCIKRTRGTNMIDIRRQIMNRILTLSYLPGKISEVHFVIIIDNCKEKHKLRSMEDDSYIQRKLAKLYNISILIGYIDKEEFIPISISEKIFQHKLLPTL